MRVCVWENPTHTLAVCFRRGRHLIGHSAAPLCQSSLFWPPYSNLAVIGQSQSSNRALTPIAQSGILHFTFQSVSPNRANRQFCSNRAIFTPACPHDCFPFGRDTFLVSSGQSLNRSRASNRVNRARCAIAQSGTRSNRANRAIGHSGNRASASIVQS